MHSMASQADRRNFRKINRTESCKWHPLNFELVFLLFASFRQICQISRYCDDSIGKFQMTMIDRTTQKRTNRLIHVRFSVGPR